MNTFTFEHFRKAMQGGLERQLKLLAFALAGASGIYTVIAAWMLNAPGAPGEPPWPVLGALGGVALAILAAAAIVPGLRLRRRNYARLFKEGLRLGEGGIVKEPGDIVAALLRVHFTVRWALAEGAGVLSLAGAVIAKGAARGLPLAYVILLPAVMAPFLILSQIPDAGRLEALFEDAILRNPSNNGSMG